MTSLTVFSSPAGNWDDIPIKAWLSGCFDVGPTGILILTIFGELFFFFCFVLPKRGFVFLSCHKVSINTPRANTKRSTEMCLDSVAQMQPSKLHGGLFDNPAVVMQVIGGEGVGGLQRCLRDWLCTDALRL